MAIDRQEQGNVIDTFERGHSYAMLAYQMFQKGCDSSGYLVQTSVGSYQHYQAHALRESVDGLNAYALLPQANTNNEVLIVFAGTQDLSGIIRDLEPVTAGGSSFQNALYDLHEHFSELVAKLPQDRTYQLNIAGHSLGGSDAEHFLAHFLQEKVADNAFAQINKVELFSFSSPGLSEMTVNDSEANIQKLIEDESTDFSVQLHYGRGEEDAVPWFGEKHIIVDHIDNVADTDCMMVIKDTSCDDVAMRNNVYQFAYYLATKYHAHILDWFEDDGSANFESFRYLSTENGDYEQIHSILHDKVTWIGHLLEAPKAMVSGLLEWFKGGSETCDIVTEQPVYHVSECEYITDNVSPAPSGFSLEEQLYQPHEVSPAA